MTVRVRFAPSPTGHLHVGGARTAIFNWLSAPSTTAPEDMRARERILQTRMNYMHRAMAADDALYAVLSPAQRKTFDRMLTGYNEGARLPTGAPPAATTTAAGGAPMMYPMVGGCGLLCTAGIAEY